MVTFLSEPTYVYLILPPHLHWRKSYHFLHLKVIEVQTLDLMSQDNWNGAEGISSLLMFFYIFIRTGLIPMDMRYVRVFHDIWRTFLLVKYTVVMPLIPVNLWIRRLFSPSFQFNLAFVGSEAASELRDPFTVISASPSMQLSSCSILKCGDEAVSSTQLKKPTKSDISSCRPKV